MQNIIKKQRDGFITYQKEGEIDFWQIVNDYIDGKISGKNLGRVFNIEIITIGNAPAR
ncbi:hypothetical protein AB7303_05260 [Providencia rettgeri]